MNGHKLTRLMTSGVFDADSCTGSAACYKIHNFRVGFVWSQNPEDCPNPASTLMSRCRSSLEFHGSQDNLSGTPPNLSYQMLRLLFVAAFTFRKFRYTTQTDWNVGFLSNRSFWCISGWLILAIRLSSNWTPVGHQNFTLWSEFAVVI